MLELLLYRRVAKLICNGVDWEKLSLDDLTMLTSNLNDIEEPLSADLIKHKERLMIKDLIERYGDLNLINIIDKLITSLRRKKQDETIPYDIRLNLTLVISVSKTMLRHSIEAASLEIGPKLILGFYRYSEGKLKKEDLLESLRNVSYKYMEWEESDPQLGLFECESPSTAEFSFRHINRRNAMLKTCGNVIKNTSKTYIFMSYIRDIIAPLDHKDEIDRSMIKVIMDFAEHVKVSVNVPPKPQNQMVIKPIRER
ncbi:MAG TPA: hypothetical protein DCY94_03700 [Firmicutes bacterium]|nr:hypothetical protein [Bacillota bacterium]